MQQDASSRLWSVIALLILLVLGTAVIYGIIKSPGVVGSLATASAAVIAVVIGQERQRRAELRQSHRERMAPIYEELVERVSATPDPEDPSGPAFYRQLNLQLLLYGPVNVIRAWLTWTSTTAADPDEPRELLIAYEPVLRAIREDLGHDNSGLNPGDLQRLYIKSDELDPLFGPFQRVPVPGLEQEGGQDSHSRDLEEDSGAPSGRSYTRDDSG
jgi:hypothetical protein